MVGGESVQSQTSSAWSGIGFAPFDLKPSAAPSYL